MEQRSVLICDDDDQIRLIASRLFAADGWAVVGAVEHAAAAVGLATTLRPDLVVLDVGLQGISGLDIIPELVGAGAAVVVCSSFGSSYAPALQMGAAAIVDKADLASLVLVANSVMAERHAPAASA